MKYLGLYRVLLVTVSKPGKPPSRRDGDCRWDTTLQAHHHFLTPKFAVLGQQITLLSR